jgi:hypothetical protein
MMHCPLIQDGCCSPDICKAEGECHYTGTSLDQRSGNTGSMQQGAKRTPCYVSTSVADGDVQALSAIGGVIGGAEWMPGDRQPTAPAPVEPPGTFSADMHTHTSKPSNPKDIVGVRKVAMSVLPFNVLADVALGLMEGAAKYGRHNYRGVGVRASVYYDATMRHLGAWWEGEDIDEASELSHVTKAISSLVVLRDAMMQGKCEDDRAPRSVPFMDEANARAAGVVDTHADKSPYHYTIKDAV